MPELFEIKGGAGPFETAAIMAAVEAAWQVEAGDLAESDGAFDPGAWVLAGRPRAVSGPRSSFRGLLPTGGDRDEETEEET